MLSILTLGIYSAWAKVRNKRYFYGHTSVAGSSFDYHAKPIQILKGRAIVVAFLVLYNLAISFIPLITPLFSLLFFFGIPFLILRATKFNMQYSSHRQIRFNFMGEYLYIFFHFIVLPLASVFSLGLAYPYAIYKQKQYISNNTKYGDALFHFSGKSKEFFLTYFLATLLMIALYMAIISTFNIFDASSWEAFKEGFMNGLKTELAQTETLKADGETDMNQVYAILAGVYGFLILNILLFSTFVNTRLTNYLFNNLELKEITFSSHISFWHLLWIYTSNLFLIILTMGLFIPWAKVRAVSYKLSCITLFSDDLGEFISEEEQKTSVLGEEFSDFLDIDIGF
jgi:uncharacterized membrane protein YjgN (DUF898 family)